VKRRDLVAGALGTFGLSHRSPQDTSRTRGAADPLRDPGVAGMPRAEVTPLDNDEAIKAVERRLKCTCGCNLDIFTCRTTDFTCTYSPLLHQEVLALHTAGKSGEEIIEAFVAKHGEAVLLKPVAQGFNVLGYLLPGSVVLVAAATVGFVLLRRHRRRLVAASPGVLPTTGSDTALTSEEQDRLARALAELES
jgi:cytochrome c-type biogenesis protein CcmH